MAEFKILSATPSSIGGRVLSNSDISRLASSIKGKVNVAPKPEYKPAPMEVTVPVVEKPVEPEPAKTIEAEVVEPVVEEQKPVVDEPVVVEPELELDEAKVEEVEEPAAETVEEVAGTDISVLGLSATNERNLRNNNLTTVEALEAFVSEHDLESLPKIGVKAQETILEALIKWQDEQKQN